MKEYRDASKNKVLVIGGGIAGLHTALSLADYGFKAYIVDKNPFLGGNAARLFKYFPTGDCSFCMSSAEELPGIRKCFYRSGIPNLERINILTNTTVKEISGNKGNFKVKLEKKPRYVDEDKCVECGLCSQVCDVEVESEFDAGIGKRKAIYIPTNSQAIPRVYTIDKENCTNCKKCIEVCKVNAIEMNQKKEELELNVGAIVVATGFDEWQPFEMKNYKYGIYDNVITQVQLARMLDPAGPFRGVPKRLSDGKEAKRIVMIQCVGSRDDNHEYCSKICCMYAMKHGINIKEQNPEKEVFICYMDIRSPGDYEEWYANARKKGVTFIRGRPGGIVEDPKTKKLVVDVEDTLSGKVISLKADLVVLTAAIVPSAGTIQIANLLKLEKTEYGFIKHSPADPTKTSMEGIYVCGTATGPKDVPDSIVDSSAAVMDILRDFKRTG